MNAISITNKSIINPVDNYGVSLRYNRKMIKAPTWRIKEWDYYLVLSKDFAGAFTISDDETVIKVKDMMCFAEKVHNRY